MLAVGADHAGLRQVNMGVDEPRCDQGVRVFDQLDIVVEALQQIGSVTHRNDLAVLDQQQAVGKVFIGCLQRHFGRVGEAVNDGGAVSFTAGN